jgi:hypothetical protein
MLCLQLKTSRSRCCYTVTVLWCDTETLSYCYAVLADFNDVLVWRSCAVIVFVCDAATLWLWCCIYSSWSLWRCCSVTWLYYELLCSSDALLWRLLHVVLLCYRAVLMWCCDVVKVWRCDAAILLLHHYINKGILTEGERSYLLVLTSSDQLLFLLTLYFSVLQNNQY